MLDMAKILHVDVESLIGRPWQLAQRWFSGPGPGRRPAGHDPQGSGDGTGLAALGAPIRWRGRVRMIRGRVDVSTSRSTQAIVDLMGIRLGMNCGPMLPFMPTTEPLWSLFAEVVPLCFRL